MAGGPGSIECAPRTAARVAAQRQLRGVQRVVVSTVAVALVGLAAAQLAFATSAQHAPSARDTTPPSAPKVRGPRLTSNHAPTFRFRSVDSGTPTGKLRYRCAFDSRNLHACRRIYRQHLTTRQHLLRVTALDRAGNQSRITTVHVSIIGSEPSHEIAIRNSGGVGAFYDRISGAPFVPRGNGYVRVGGSPIPEHDEFRLGSYDALRAEAGLERMHADGYNVVRVWLDSVRCPSDCLRDPLTRGLSTAYMKNVADFIRRAKANHLFVMLTNDWLPDDSIYSDMLAQSCCSGWGGYNLYQLSQGGVAATSAFWRDVIRRLIVLRAPLDAILAYELRNELWFDSDMPPLSQASGLVTPEDGVTYDMSSSSDRQRMLDDNLVYWINHIRSAIREVDPTALVTVGFFPPQGPNTTRVGDPRVIETGPAIEQSTADFIDLHAYLEPPGGLTLAQLAENYGITSTTRKPVIMGEFGASTYWWPTPAQAAAALQSWQSESCKFGFDGWILFTWDTSLVEWPNHWSAEAGHGEIAQALAPKNRPDPCS